MQKRRNGCTGAAKDAVLRRLFYSDKPLYRGTALSNGNKSTHSPYDVFTVNKFSFSEHTTYGCGGFAEEAYFPTDAAKTAFIYDKLNSDNKKIYIIGNGSNILAADGVIHGENVRNLPS